MLTLTRETLSVAITALFMFSCAGTKPAPGFFAGFDGYSRQINSNSLRAEQFFEQGLQLLYGYNHDEAIRSFEEAAAADPECVMAHWGVAYANGLHINNPEMSEAASKAAFEAARAGLAVSSSGSPVEQALMQAVAERYAWPVPEDRSSLDQAYADAMNRVWERFPNDADVGALYAESLMNLQPWDLWTANGEPKGRTLEIVDVLEQTLELDPLHPGANHFYIHTVEASNEPERAVPCADRLVDLVPGAGHLVHMPSHIYTRVGRYADAADANIRAIAADKAYFKRAPAPQFYNIYFLHNVHFLSYASMMEGRYAAAMQSARQIEAEIPQEFLAEYAMYADGLMSTALHVMIRFGKWEAILEEPAPPQFRVLSRAQRRYARAIALAALDRTSEARNELAEFDVVAPQVPEEWTVGVNPASQALAICREMMLGEILYREGALGESLRAMQRAVALEDQLVYDEPPGWMQPVRHALGALLLSSGRNELAEEVYREDLKRNPENGWALLGLEQTLRALGQEALADKAEARRKQAWARADTAPNSSCYCESGVAPASSSPTPTLHSTFAKLSSSLNEYAIRNGGRFPESLEVLVTPDANGVSFYPQRTLPQDPWNREFVYRQLADSYGFELASFGADGVPGGRGANRDAFVSSESLD